MTVWYAYQTVTYTEWHKPGVALIQLFSWWRAHGCPKHVENINKHIRKNCASSWLFTRIKCINSINCSNPGECTNSASSRWIKHIFHYKPAPLFDSNQQYSKAACVTSNCEYHNCIAVSLHRGTDTLSRNFNIE